MKKLIYSSLVMAALMFSGVSLTSATFPETGKIHVAKTKTTKVAKAVSYKVDATASTLTWNAKKVTGEHNGNVKITKGDLMVEKNKVTGGIIELDMTSISDVDNSARLVNHLKSDDFFSSEKFPVSTFKISRVTPIKGAGAGSANYTVAGNLTIKGITKPLSFPATIDVKNNLITAKSENVKINRLEYDIKFRSLSFFSDIGDKAIEDTFTVKFNLVAKPGASMAKL